MAINNQNSYKQNYFLMFGHMADDLCQGALPAILAFMYKDGVLHSYTDVALLIMISTIVNAVAQPLTGYFADKKPRPYIMTIGMLTAALGVMFLGIVENIYLMMLLVAINGIGVAIFHPSAGQLAHVFAGAKMGRGMSIFSVGGNIGYALGALYFTLLYMLFGLYATLLIIVPASIMGIIFMTKRRFYNIYLQRRFNRTKRKVSQGLEQENYLGTLTLLLLIFCRSAAIFGLTTFLPLYFMQDLSVNKEFANISITFIGIFGAFATFFGGPYADKFGFTQFVRIMSLIAIPFIFIFTQMNNEYLALLSLMPFAFCFYACMSTTVIIGQKLLPRHLGMATGITLGLGISLGGLIAPLLGYVGDNYGLHYSMLIIAALIALAFVVSLILPIVNQPQKELKLTEAKA